MLYNCNDEAKISHKTLRGLPKSNNNFFNATSLKRPAHKKKRKEVSYTLKNFNDTAKNYLSNLYFIKLGWFPSRDIVMHF